MARFFKRELAPFLTPDLDPLGRKIIEACMNDASQEDLEADSTPDVPEIYDPEPG